MYSILFVYSSPIYANGGGVQKVTQNLANQFKHKGHKVYFVSVEKYDIIYSELFNYFSLPSKKINSNENISFLINVINENNIHFIINQSGMDIKISKLCLEVKKYTNAIFITAFHNSILGGIRNYNFSKNIFKKLIKTFV